MVHKEKVEASVHTAEVKREQKAALPSKKEPEPFVPQKVSKIAIEQEKPQEKSLTKKEFPVDPKSAKKEESDPFKGDQKGRASQQKSLAQEKSPLPSKTVETKLAAETPVKDFKLSEVKPIDETHKVLPAKGSDSKSKVHTEEDKKKETAKPTQAIPEHKDISFGFPFESKKPAPPVAPPKPVAEAEKPHKGHVADKAPTNKDIIVNFNARLHAPAEAPKYETPFMHGHFPTKPAEEKNDVNLTQSMTLTATAVAPSMTLETANKISGNSGDAHKSAALDVGKSLSGMLAEAHKNTVPAESDKLNTTQLPSTAQDQKQPVKVFFDKTDEGLPPKTDNFLATSLDQGAKSVEKKNFFS